MTTAVTLIALLLSVIICIISYGYLRAGKMVGLAIMVFGLGIAWGGWCTAEGWNPFASEPDPKIALRASQWACTAAHEEQATSVIPAGKVMIPITTRQKVCDRYARR